MRVDYEDEEYIRGCVKTCEKKRHLQQVAYSTFHDCFTQICFTCKVVRTSLPESEQVKMKTNQSLKSFEKEVEDE